MEPIAIHMALHGVIVLTVGIVAGLILYVSILKHTNVADWHLVHASVTARGVVLIALAAILNVMALPSWSLATAAWLTIFFVWTSTLAMIIRAVTKETGRTWGRASGTNKLIYGLYTVGTVAVFPACFLLIAGLVNAL